MNYLLAQYRNIGNRTIELASLRTMLQLEKKYPLFANFRRFVLEVSIKQINEHSPLKATYKPIKKGRKIASIEFIFEGKNNNKVKAQPKEFYKASQLLTKEQRSKGKEQIAKLKAVIK
ncbi:replication initiation protein [Candidatus Nitrosacidococcus tergens]|nr:replication initiation protein [Candidatus Nitrosacidococcus tergens]